MSPRYCWTHAKDDLKKCANKDCENPLSNERGFLSTKEFHNNSCREDGLNKYCKVCVSLQNAKNRASRKNTVVTIKRKITEIGDGTTKNNNQRLSIHSRS
jgi:hypothetical protein